MENTNAHEVTAGVTLVGRDHEVELLGSFVDQLAIDGDALLLWGEAGVGKSALLEVAAQGASTAGIKVLRAAGAEFEADLSFAGLHHLLFAYRKEIEQLGPPHSAALHVALGLAEGPPADSLVISNATLLLLRRIATTGPVLVIVDDLPWVDQASARVMGFVARRLSGSRVGFVGAARAGSEGSFERGAFAEHNVEPLDSDAATRLIEKHFPTLAPEVRRRVLAEAQGNPLALLELPSALSGQQRSASRALPALLPLGRRLQALFEARITQLPGSTRDLLLLSVLEGSGDMRILRACAGEDQSLRDLAPAETGRIVHVDDRTDRMEFRHPLIRSALVELSTSDERRRVHQRLAEHFADQPERRAWHLGQATTTADEEVAALLEAAARLTGLRGDAERAVAAMTRAADLSQSPTERSRRLIEAAYLGAHLAGDLRGASRNLGQARQADPQLGPSLYAAATTAYLLMSGDGDVESAHRLLIGAIETHLSSGDRSDPGLAYALHQLFAASFVAGRPDLWERFNGLLNRLASYVPADLHLITQFHADPVRTALAHLGTLTAAIASLATERDPYTILTVSTAAAFVDRLGDCRQGLWQAARGARESGGSTIAAYALGHLCHDDILTGQWAEAQELADEGVALCQASGDRFMGWPSSYYEALLGAHRGAPDITRAWTQEIIEWARPRGALTPLSAAHHASALLAVGLGDFEDAYQHAAAISPPGTFAPYAPYALWVMLDLVEAAVRTDRLTEAAAHVAAMKAESIAELSPRLALIVGGATAIAATDGAAADLFDRALALPGIQRWPFDVARVQLAHGERLRRGRAPLEARKHLTAAFDTFQRLGAEPWGARAGNELRAAGGSSGVRRDGGPTELTAQELEIATLAAAGLSNKQIGDRLFLSHRTVGAHLYRIFPKLGVTSRAALRDALSDISRRAGRRDDQ